MTEQVTCTVMGPRAETFRQVFGTDTVVIQGPTPRLAQLPGLGETYVYLLDLDCLTADQRSKLVSHLAVTFGIAVDEVESDLDTVGMPILAEDCMVNVPPGLAFSMMDVPHEHDRYGESEYDSFEIAAQECGRLSDGTCTLAGTEHCDFECPFRD